MKTAIILHGMPDKEEYYDLTNNSQSNSHWLPWIQKQLTVNNILAQTPEMPEPYEPNYEKWKKLFEQFTVNENTILIGHSCGGGFLVRWLSENKVKVGKVVLVAPWIDPHHEYESTVADFFNFKFDSEVVSRTDGLIVFYSIDDYSDIVDTVKILENNMQNIVIRKFEDKGHFVLSSMKTEKFPELLEEVLK